MYILKFLKKYDLANNLSPIVYVEFYLTLASLEIYSINSIVVQMWKLYVYIHADEEKHEKLN